MSFKPLILVLLWVGAANAQDFSEFPPPSLATELENTVAPAMTLSLANDAAQLSLPSASQPGFLQLPDGQTFRVVDWSSNSMAGDMQSPTSAASPAAGDGGGTAEADNGTNPAQNTTTFIASNEFYELDGDNQIDTTYARFKFPIYDKRGSFLLEIPFAYFDFTSSDPLLPQVGGLGDVKFQVGYNSWVSDNKKLTMINFLEFYVPSADTALITTQPGGNELTAFNLGTGKYVLGPGLGFVYAVKKNFIIAPLYFYEASVAGDDDRVDIRRGKWRIFAMYAWESGAYVLPEFQVLTNYLTGNNDAYVAPEIGYSSKKTTFYVKPGVGIQPDFNDRQWGIEFGARVQF